MTDEAASSQQQPIYRSTACVEWITTVCSWKVTEVEARRWMTSTSAPDRQEGPITHKSLQYLIPLSESGGQNGFVQGLNHLAVVSHDPYIEGWSTLLRNSRENRTALVLSPNCARSQTGLWSARFSKSSLLQRLDTLKTLFASWC